MTLSRRALLAKGSLLAGGAALSTLPHWTRRAGAATSSRLPVPPRSGIEHVVVVMMENRSFDHFLGWLPNANGRQAGLKYYDKQNQRHSTFHLTSPQNCNYEDPDHSYSGGHIQYDNGACDGWLKAGTNDLFPIGYYVASDLPFLSRAASN